MRILVFWIFPFILLSSCGNEQHTHRKQKSLERFHRRLITLDSHTDTPLNLMNGDFNFFDRHDASVDGTRVDLPRIEEGGLDGIFMAVFLGQQDRNAEAYIKAELKARMIIGSINSLIGKGSERLELAIEPRDLRRIHRKKKHAVYMGLENGYPLGLNISLVDTFYNMGIRYITLCHTLNNDICDSSTDPGGAEFHGLSDFGYTVVDRMNELGMMIDVSHASDESFYDVIEASTKPVIASHSCARAICDNPRNLDDEMLKALADNGGVVQMCILSAYVESPESNPQRDSAKDAVIEKCGNYYELDQEMQQEFLKEWYAVDREFPPELATVEKVVDHIDHIVEVAGIDHVGIGTDFDGGGGLADCNDVSEIRNITDELLKRGYARKDIRKIWGKNLMRVMREQR